MGPSTNSTVTVQRIIKIKRSITLRFQSIFFKTQHPFQMQAYPYMYVCKIYWECSSIFVNLNQDTFYTRHIK